jgi:uncharacterized membrane protein HdeD (DUF308 family)
MSNTNMCPMASMCKGMAQKPGSGYMLMVPGIVFIVAGILIILEPKILVWLIASISILMGIMMLFMANFFRKMNSL